MLQSLKVENYALIDSLEVVWGNKFNVLTGETGAGKSMLLGALTLLEGKKADVTTLLNKNKKCIVEGSFIIHASLKNFFNTLDIDFQEETIIRREIAPNGRSRGFVNDMPVVLETLRRLAFHLIDIHSQHQNLKVANQQFQLDLIDTFVDNISLRKKYQKSYHQWKILEQKVTKRKKTLQEKEEKSDYNQFLFDELNAVAIQEHEEIALEKKIQSLSHAQEIEEKLLLAAHTLTDDNGVLTHLSNLLAGLNKISNYDERFLTFAERVESCSLELNDISNELFREKENVNLEPEQLQQLQERLDQINRLNNKHQVSSTVELLEIQKKLHKTLLDSDNLEKSLNLDEQEMKILKEKTFSLAKTISEKRMRGFDKLKSKLEKMLIPLGIPNIKIRFQCAEILMGEQGIDRVDLLFSANKGFEPVNIKQGASGGELSRLMFTIKAILAEKMRLPTLILDEVDTGISGEIAIKMAKQMGNMGQNTQLIVISHLPQIASKANKHFSIFKNNSSIHTTTHLRHLNEEDRIIEIAQMLGGMKPSKIAIDNAKEMLTQSNE